MRRRSLSLRARVTMGETSPGARSILRTYGAGQDDRGGTYSR
jgi:hypothetical protein